MKEPTRKATCVKWIVSIATTVRHTSTCIPDDALDRKLAEGDIPQELPYVKQQALELITANYETSEQAREAITEGLNNWYGDNYSQIVAENPSCWKKPLRALSQPTQKTCSLR